ncbi:MAG: hypothetical protein HKN04_00015 [Rhodothermaceae bacterium]|nr:hypothetical protein [Rhodothermaceae bacterium]
MGEQEKGRLGAWGRRGLLVFLPLVLSLALPLPSAAQTPDSLAAEPLAAPRPRVYAEGPAPGRAVSPIPARTPALDPADALEALPGAFRYTLGAPGWPDGLSLGGRAPDAHALTLGGLPFTDLFTERPREDLVPLEVLDRFRMADGRYGRPGAVVATVRPFRAEAPLTELRYLPGQEGLQYIGATHTQTRRPPRLLRDAAGRGRLIVLGHVAGRQATGPYTGEALGGWHALGRLTLVRPGFSVDLTELHVRHTHGARSGLGSTTGIFSDVFYPTRASVLDPEAERQTERNDLALTLRAPVLSGEPLTVAAYWTRQHEHYTLGGFTADTLQLRGNRFGGWVTQAVRAGPHGFLLRLDGWLDDAPWGRMNPMAGAGVRTQLHATLGDTLTVAGWRIEAEGGAHAVGSEVFPSASLRVDGRRVFASVGYAGAVPGRIEEVGYADLAQAAPELNRSRTLSAEAGLQASTGRFGVQLRGFASQTTDPRVLVAEGDTAYAFQDVGASFRRLGGTLALDWRADAPRGLYATAAVTVHTLLDPDQTPIRRREADALPTVWGSARLGFRALDLFGGALDLDLAAQGRAWSTFQSRVFIPAVALFALSDPTTTVNVPSRGTLDLLAAAQLQERATIFLVYENALAQRVYDGAYVVPVYPLPAHRLRFGVAWTLFN